MAHNRLATSSLVTREASFVPNSLREEGRTVDVVWTTGASVKRVPWMGGEPYYERLSLDSGDVDLSRLNSGAPVLNSHAATNLTDQIGVVERAWIEDGKGFATIKLSSRKDVNPIFEDIKAGIIRNISVGYKVHKYKEEKREGENIKTFVATRWEPMEISFVPIPADGGAQVRGDEAVTMGQEERVEVMGVENGATETAEIKNATSKAKTEAGEARALPRDKVDEIRSQERIRIKAINALCDKHSMPSEVRADLVNIGASVDEARKVVLEHILERSADEITRRPYNLSLGRNEVDVRREAIPNAILHRHDPGSVELMDAAREYRGMSLLEIARLYADVPQGRFMDKREIAKRAFSTSDFPELLGETSKRKILSSYENIMKRQSFQKLVTVRSLPDFKETTEIRLTDTPNFLPLPEGAEYKFGYKEATKEKWSLVTYGRKMGISRQAIINDDLGAFERLGNWGIAAARLEIFLFWSVFNDNPEMGDGVKLFSTDHHNLEDNVKLLKVPSIEAITSARVRMRRQKTIEASLDRDRLAHKAGRNLGLTPKYMIVPPELEEHALKIVMPGLYAAKNDDKNPYQGYFEIIVGDELEDLNAWYMSCDKGQGIDLVHMGYLDGIREPYVEYVTDFDTDQVAVKARMDVACKAFDWKGFYKNPGKAS